MQQPQRKPRTSPVFFVNAGVGTAHYHATAGSTDIGSDSDTSGQITVGWRKRFIGVEAGYVDLGSVSARDKFGDSAKLSGDGWTFGLDGHFNPTRMWYISARGGLFLWKLHGKASLANGAGSVTQYSNSRQSSDWYAGVGTGVDFNRHISLGVNFDFYKISKHDVDIDNKVYTVNFEYRF